MPDPQQSSFGNENLPGVLLDPQVTITHRATLIAQLVNHGRYARSVMLVDIDGVVLNNNHRLPHIVDTGPDGRQVTRADADWQTFHSLGHLDTPGVFAPVVEDLIRVYIPIFLTARVEIWEHTRKALADQLSGALGRTINPNLIVFRERQASGRVKEFKRNFAKELIESGIRIGVAIDDSHENCEQFRSLGIPTLRAYNHLRDDALLY